MLSLATTFLLVLSAAPSSEAATRLPDAALVRYSCVGADGVSYLVEQADRESSGLVYRVNLERTGLICAAGGVDDKVVLAWDVYEQKPATLDADDPNFVVFHFETDELPHRCDHAVPGSCGQFVWSHRAVISDVRVDVANSSTAEAVLRDYDRVVSARLPLNCSPGLSAAALKAMTGAAALNSGSYCEELWRASQ
jgi:hypothetical protein